MNTIDVFAQRITELRANKDKKRQETADEIGISRASLEYYEKGKRKPDIETLVKLAEYYDVSTDYLVGLTDAKTNDKGLQFVCDFLGTDEFTVNTLKDFLPTDKERRKWYTAFLTSPFFQNLFTSLFRLILLHKNLGSEYVEELKELQEVFQKSGEEIFKEHSETFNCNPNYDFFSVDISEFSPHHRKNIWKLREEIELDEYRAQKSVNEIINYTCDEYKGTLEKDKIPLLDFNSLEEYVNKTVPNNNFFASAEYLSHAVTKAIKEKVIEYMRSENLGFEFLPDSLFSKTELKENDKGSADNGKSAN